MDKKPQIKQKDNEKESAKFSEWKKSPAVCAWARVQPHIGDDDLRPYLFVSKERKDYFGATSALGHLASVAEMLLGKKFQVIAMQDDLKRLAQPEATQVFEILRTRIVITDTFDTEPAGIAGLTVLVKVHPHLQPVLMDFLESLPDSKLGPWVCTGWSDILIDAAASQRFDSLLERWVKNGRTALKAAATGTLGTRHKGGY